MDSKLIWEIITKYDGDKTKKEFCDSLSKILQGDLSEDSIFSILRETPNITKSECQILDKNLGLLYKCF